MTCMDARIQRRAGCALGAWGARRGRFGQSLSSRGIRTSLCITRPRAKRGDATVTTAANCRQHGAWVCPDSTEAAV